MKNYQITQKETNRKTGSAHWSKASPWFSNPQDCRDRLSLLMSENPDQEFNVVCLVTIQAKEFLSGGGGTST